MENIAKTILKLIVFPFYIIVIGIHWLQGGRETFKECVTRFWEDRWD